MTISLRSWRCLSRRALARISIIVMLGLSSMNIGALETWPIFGTSLFQSSSVISPLRMWLQRDPRLGREQPHGDLVLATSPG